MNSLRIRDIFAAIIISLLIVMPFASYILQLAKVSEAIASNVGLIIGYGLMFTLCRHCSKSAGVSVSDISGRSFRTIFVPLAIAHAFLQLMFASGENFMAAYLVAQYNAEFAYTYWNFHAGPYVLQMTAFDYVLMVAAQFIVAPLVEEYVFRGLLLRVWSYRWGISKAILINAALFAALHVHRHYFASTFIFGLVMCLLYVRYQSLWVNVLTHAVFNLFSFFYEYVFNLHWMKALGDIGRLSSWSGEMVMLLVSVPVLFFFILKNWPESTSLNNAGPIN